jgi:alkaline phosphatase
MFFRRTVSIAAGLIVVVSIASVAAAEARHVILLISDGQGFNAVTATRYYAGSPAAYENGDWAAYSVQTSSAKNPAGYQPQKMWADFAWQFNKPTDSAAAATAICSGRKVPNGLVNVADGATLRTFFESAASEGMSIGALTTVQFCHATPAGV